MDMERDYYEDVQFFTSGIITFWLSVLVIGLAIFPFVAKNYYVYVANYMTINSIALVRLHTWDEQTYDKNAHGAPWKNFFPIRSHEFQC